MVPRLRLPLMAALAFAGEARAQEAAPAPAGDSGPPAICTDRPTKSDASCTVDPGYWQVETDLLNGTFQRQGGVTTETWLATNPTLKYGLAKDIDLELNIAPYEVVRTHDAAGDHTIGGLGDLYLRMKYLAVDDGGFQIALVPYVKAPTARLGVGDGAWEAGINVPIHIALDSRWTLVFSPELDAFKDPVGDGRHLDTSQTINLSYSLPKDVTVYGELWADWSFQPGGVVKQASLDFAVTKLVGKLFQLDGGVNIGLDRATPGVQVYAGLSKKW